MSKHPFPWKQISTIQTSSVRRAGMRSMLALFLVVGTFWRPLIAEPAVTADTRLKLIKTLIEESSSARQVEKSSNPQARTKREEARQLYQDAIRASKAGDTERMNALLTQATQVMVAAVRMADQLEVVAVKAQDQLDHRLESVRVLIDAHERIAQEKDLKVANEELRSELEPKLVQVRELIDQDDFGKAGEILGQAYDTVKQGVQKLREGDTLVRSLHFETEEEEYYYELDRNDTHKMLVEVLIREKMASAHIENMAEPFIVKADQLRQEAEKLAVKKHYEEAMQKLELSTRQLVRAIRGAGVYIPG